MITAYDAYTNSRIQIQNPDEERNTLVRRQGENEEQKLWRLSRNESWGSQRICVYRSTYLQKMLWYYPKDKIWVVMTGYDELREDNDTDYANRIYYLMSKPSSAYMTNKVTTTTTTTTTTTVTTESDKPLRKRKTKRKTDDTTKSENNNTVQDNLKDIRDTKEGDTEEKKDIEETEEKKEKKDMDLKQDPEEKKDIQDTKEENKDTEDTKEEKKDMDLKEVNEKDKKEIVDSKEETEEMKDMKKPENKEIKAQKTDDSDDDETPLILLFHKNKKTKRLESEIDNVRHLTEELQELRQKTANLEAEKQTKNKQIADLETDKSNAESKAVNAERLHNNYKSRQRNAVSEAKKKADTLESQISVLTTEKASNEQERNRMQDDYDKAQDRARKQIAAARAGNADPYGKDGGEPCIGAYKELIKQAHTCYQTVINTAATGKALVSNDAKYQVFDAMGNWIDLDTTLEVELDKLQKLTDRVSYSFGQHTYETRLADSNDTPPNWQGQSKFSVYAVQKNTNPQYLTTRYIIRNQQQQQPQSTGKGTLTDAQKHEILFGKSLIHLPPGWVDDLLARFSFNEEHYHTSCRELAELAELFNTLSNNFKYTTKKTHKTDIYVKPVLLFNWLTIAKARNYTYMRLVLHGADSTCYNGVRDDPVGMDLKFAGMHGQAYGNGFYFGLSDHVTIGYNREGKPGTALIALVLTHEKIDHQQHHGGYHTFDSTHQVPYTTFQLTAPKSGTHNCIVVHESALILILGKIVAI